MLDAKVKLKDVQTGQESLLLVIKMNLKGILVVSPQPIPKDAPLALSLQLNDDAPPVQLRGEVHKIAEQTRGNRGVIIRFLGPSRNDLARIDSYLRKHDPAFSPQPSVKIPPPSREETAIHVIPPPPNLALQSPDRDAGFVAATLDEEAVHARHPGLGGETRVFSPADVVGRGRKRIERTPIRSALRLVAWVAGILLLGMVFFRPILHYLDAQFGLRPPPSSSEPQPPVVSPPPLTPRLAEAPPEADENTDDSAESETSSPAPAPTKVTVQKAVEAKITSYRIDDQGGFLRVSILGTGDFSLHSASRTTSPRRLIVDFPAIHSFSVNKTVTIGKNPVLRIRTQTTGDGTRVVFDLYPVDFPRYHIKNRADSLDIFFQR